MCKLTTVMLGLLLVIGHAAAGEVSPEYRVKAGFLFNFITFARWPATATGPLQLCLHGENLFGSAVEVLSQKSVNGERLEVRETSTLDEINDCDVIFLGGASPPEMQALSLAVAGRPVLTIADQQGALDQGIGINMVTRQDRIAFEIGLRAIEANGLALSSKLISLATEVRR
jgi:YfiR/HmsC-like